MNKSQPNPAPSPLSRQVAPRWSGKTRSIVASIILLYLAVLLLGPLTNPRGAPHLTVPLARAAAPAHQALFLGHGYRFFAPDPGPNHTVHYEIQCRDGTSLSGHFPDREAHWPRLLYHRWFMLSESLFREGAIVPSDQQLADTRLQYEQKIEEYYLAGKFALRQQLIRERESEEAMIEAARQRRDLLIRSIAQTLLRRNDGLEITLWMQERLLPTPEEVAGGMKLTDASLVNRVEIGTFERSRLESGEPLFDQGLEDIEPTIRSANASSTDGSGGGQ